ncbi:hypothetical protein EAI6_41040 [Enterobacter asburiae]|nr:hypothetical protein EAI6_41040 [Enterobacter asburiae]
MKVLKKFCVCTSFLIVAYSSVIDAESYGNISIKGTILNQACGHTVYGNLVKLDCGREDSGRVLDVTKKYSKVNFNTGRVTGIRWLSAEHRKGIVNVVYY